MRIKQLYRLEGFAEFEQQLKDLANGYRHDLVARQTLVKAAKLAMEPTLLAAQTRAPYDEENTGPVHLRDTLRIDARIPSSKDKLSEYVNETDAAIAVMSAKKSAVSLSQEFGNARTAAQPFLRVSLESTAREVLNKLKSELSHIIPAYAKKLRRRGIK